MHTTNLRKVGGSIMLAVPPAILELLQMRAGAVVGLAVEGGRLVVQPQSRPSYRLSELLAQCDSQAELSNEERDWVAGTSVGDELI